VFLEESVGVYSEYLDKNMDFESLCAERKTQLKTISRLREGRDILVYAADLNKSNVAISINYSDVLPFNDQLANLKGKTLDFILETPGGSGEAADDMVRVLRDKYDDIAVIVPGVGQECWDSNDNGC
jgi:ClpP class serine protease